MSDEPTKKSAAAFLASKDAWLFACASYCLSGAEAAVAMALLPHINSKTRDAWPSHQTLAELTNREPSTVWRAIQKLEELGLLKIRRGRGRNQSHRYSLAFGKMEIDARSRRRKTLRIRNENPANSKAKGCEFEGGTYDEGERNL